MLRKKIKEIYSVVVESLVFRIIEAILNFFFKSYTKVQCTLDKVKNNQSNNVDGYWTKQ